MLYCLLKLITIFIFIFEHEYIYAQYNNRKKLNPDLNFKIASTDNNIKDITLTKSIPIDW